MDIGYSCPTVALMDDAIGHSAYWEQLARRAGVTRSAMPRTPEDSPLYPDGKLTVAAVAPENIAQVQRHLRIEFARAMCHIIWWELALHGDIAVSWRAISNLADSLLRVALDAAVELLAPRYGRLEGGRYAIIALGKLGGRELNLASDLDLLTVWLGEGESSSGRRAVACDAYFAHLTRMVIRLIDERTVDGAIWPVDMRLRPGGASAPISLSLEATLDHYRDYGQTWERAMLSKARFVAGDMALAAELLEGVTPFIYMRHLDYALVNALAEMKRRIDRQGGARQVAPGFDVKRGWGGIREIEFMIQSRLLLYGGRKPGIRRTGSMEALAALVAESLIDGDDAALLGDAYRFWRRIEHAVQARAGEQTQRLPEDYRVWLDCALGVKGIHEQASRYAARVRALFVRHMESVDAQAEDVDWLHDNTALPETLAPPTRARIRSALDDVLGHLRRGLLPERSEEQLRRILARAMPRWLEDANGVTAVEAFADLVRNISGRATWIDLLATHEGALQWLIGVLSASRYIAEQIARNPAWLEWPLAQEGGADIDALCRDLAAIAVEETETALVELGRLVGHARLLCALAVDAHEADAEKVGIWLARIADAAALTALRISCHRMGLSQEFPLVMVAMGKHGSEEMGLSSDLDMVFVLAREAADGDLDRAQKLGRRVIQILTAAPPYGAGYAFDARLRPSGQSGALVTPLGGFSDYQRQHAATWEHQALCRARALAVVKEDARQVMAVVDSVLAQPRDPGALAREVVAMRDKMERHLASRDPEVVNLKQDAGGVVDIEFLAQYARLAFGGGGRRVSVVLSEGNRALPSSWRSHVRLLAEAHHRYRMADLLLQVELSCSSRTLPADASAAVWETLRRHGVFASPDELRQMMRDVRAAFRVLLEL